MHFVAVVLGRREKEGKITTEFSVKIEKNEGPGVLLYGFCS